MSVEPPYRVAVCVDDEQLSQRITETLREAAFIVLPGLPLGEVPDVIVGDRLLEPILDAAVFALGPDAAGDAHLPRDVRPAELRQVVLLLARIARLRQRVA